MGPGLSGFDRLRVVLADPPFEEAPGRVVRRVARDRRQERP
jgi:hypothetical protein